VDRRSGTRDDVLHQDGGNVIAGLQILAGPVGLENVSLLAQELTLVLDEDVPVVPALRGRPGKQLDLGEPAVDIRGIVGTPDVDGIVVDKTDVVEINGMNTRVLPLRGLGLLHLRRNHHEASAAHRTAGQCN
jgi:hypothetical protein